MENLYICRIRRKKKLEKESLVPKKMYKYQKSILLNLISCAEFFFQKFYCDLHIELKFAMYFKD